MDTNRMKLGLCHIFYENKKLSKEAKLQLIKFIEKANEHQIKVLAMDGEIITKEVLDESSKQIIDDRFAESNVSETLKKASINSLSEMPLLAVAGAAVAATYAAYRVSAMKKCKSMFPDKTSDHYKACVRDIMKNWKQSKAYQAHKKQQADKKKAMKASLPK